MCNFTGRRLAQGQSVHRFRAYTAYQYNVDIALYLATGSVTVSNVLIGIKHLYYNKFFIFANFVNAISNDNIKNNSAMFEAKKVKGKRKLPK